MKLKTRWLFWIGAWCCLADAIVEVLTFHYISPTWHGRWFDKLIDRTDL